jgi:23S rRNA G2069 N7-methylase RlmK/C1962 C5-methylase RlmI
MLAVRAGADHVVAVEAHPTLCDIARRNVAMNGLSRKVCVNNWALMICVGRCGLK